MAMTKDRLEALMAVLSDAGQRTRDEAKQCLRDEFASMLTKDDAIAISTWLDDMEQHWGGNMVRIMGPERAAVATKQRCDAFSEQHPSSEAAFEKLHKLAGRTDEPKETTTS